MPSRKIERKFNIFVLLQVQTQLLLVVLLVCIIPNNVVSYFAQCSEEDGGGVCPYGDTCCKLPNGQTGSACIPNVLGSFNGTCCYDDYSTTSNNNNNNDNNFERITGCAVGYTCERKVDTGWKYCQASSDIYDQILQQLPRYKLCYKTNNNNNYDNTTTMYHNDDDIYSLQGLRIKDTGKAIFPYYSSHGSITDTVNNNQRINNIQFAIINIHGALRNADDLYCSTIAAVQRQYQLYTNNNVIPMNNVLVIAPRFTASTDNDTNINIVTPLIDYEIIQWDANDGGFGGAWRFGANAVWPPYSVDISSYDAMDILVQTVLTNLPNLQHLSILGHSAGGQFVQRWSILTNVWDNTRMSSVVSNPSSYAYLTEYRKITIPTTSDDADDDDDDSENSNNNNNNNNKVWGIPDTTICPLYNQWMFGFEGIDNNDDTVTSSSNSTTSNSTNRKRTYTVPYIQRILQSLKGSSTTGSTSTTTSSSSIDKMINRFAQRLIIYLAGELDHCNSTRAHRSPTCNSHGLQASCSDEIQGNNRMERHLNYYHSLQEIVYTNSTSTGIELNQYRDVVPNTGHDYSLIFTSIVGLRAIFNPQSYIPKTSSYYQKNQQQQQQHVVKKVENKKVNILSSTASIVTSQMTSVKEGEQNQQHSSNDVQKQHIDNSITSSSNKKNYPSYHFFLRDVQSFIDNTAAKSKHRQQNTTDSSAIVP